MLDRRSGARAGLASRLGGGAARRQRDTEHVVDHRSPRADLRPVDVDPGTLQRTGEQREQTGAVVRADLDDQSPRRAVEPQDPRRGGRVSGPEPRSAPRRPAWAAHRLTRCSSVPSTSICAAERTDELLAQQARGRRAAEVRRHHEFADRDAVLNVDRRRMHAQRVQRQHPGSLGQQPALVRGDHHRVVKALAFAGPQLDVHLAVGRQRNVLGVERVGLRQRLAVHRHPTAPHQVADQRGLPVAPHPGPGGQRVGLGQRVQHVQQHRVAVQRLADRGDGLRVVEVLPDRDLRQQQVVVHQLGQHLDIRRPHAQPGADLGGQLSPQHAVIDVASLTDVVQQRRERSAGRNGPPGW